MPTLSNAHVDARAAAVARIGLGVGLLLTTVETYRVLWQVADGSAVAMPWVSGLPAPTVALVLGHTLLSVLCAAGVLLGFRLPWTAAASALLAGVVMVWEQQTYSSHRTLFVLLAVYLAFSRADATWAVRPRVRAGSVPFWPLALMLSQVSVCYLFGALSKVNPVFLSGGVLEHAMWLHVPDALMGGLPLLTVLAELFIAVGLWVPRLRVVAVLVGAGLHLSIVATMTEAMPLAAFAVVCLSLYPLFLLRPVFTSTNPARPAASPAATAVAATPVPLTR